MHNDISHWDFKLTEEFLSKRGRWPNLRSEVSNIVRSCEVCQKTKRGNREELPCRIPISGLFNTWYVYFAGPLPKIENGNQYLLFCIELSAKCPVARDIPAELFNSLRTLKFFKQEIILPSGMPMFILSDNDLTFDCKAIDWFTRDQKIR